jgi:D-beta-D-heptose 7-phosphate kinase/D-beta-D-heptose 1-phosphate adenosyltransferase
VAAQSSGAPVIVDPKGRDFARQVARSMIRPNASELAGATGLSVETDADIETALVPQLSATTAKGHRRDAGRQGMSLIRREGRARESFPVGPRVFDRLGAGDTGLAALGLALKASVAGAGGTVGHPSSASLSETAPRWSRLAS